MKGAVYQCLYNGPGQFIIIKRWVKDGQQKRMDYEVSFKKGKWMCDPKCKGFNMSKVECIHIKHAQLCVRQPELMADTDRFDWCMHLKYKEEE